MQLIQLKFFIYSHFGLKPPRMVQQCRNKYLLKLGWLLWGMCLLIGVQLCRIRLCQSDIFEVRASGFQSPNCCLEAYCPIKIPIASYTISLQIGRDHKISVCWFLTKKKLSREILVSGDKCSKWTKCFRIRGQLLEERKGVPLNSVNVNRDSD